MRMRITSEVYILGILGAKIKDEYVEYFEEDENVFGRMLKYHKRMEKVFPKCKYKLLKAKKMED